MIKRHLLKKIVRAMQLFAVAVLISVVRPAGAQSPEPGMRMSTRTLLLAQLDGRQVTGESSSKATGTGAFVLDSLAHTLTYSLTYQGLEAGAPRTIALYNFGAGKNGRLVGILCGPGAPRCPRSPSATISGDVGHESALGNDLTGEFDAGRVYVEIVGGGGSPEIRGQLGLNSAMVKVANYISHLVPIRGTDSKGTGTAILSETYLPGGKVAVFYALTVAGTSSAPTRAVLTGNAIPKASSLSALISLPPTEQWQSRDKTGGSLSGSYDINATAPSSMSTLRLLSVEHPKIRLVVITGRFRTGELYGDLKPVR
jgi:hypothetical protein